MPRKLNLQIRKMIGRVLKGLKIRTRESYPINLPSNAEVIVEAPNFPVIHINARQGRPLSPRTSSHKIFENLRHSLSSGTDNSNNESDWATIDDDSGEKTFSDEDSKSSWWISTDNENSLEDNFSNDNDSSFEEDFSGEVNNFRLPDHYSQATQDYIDSLKNKKKFSEIIQEMKLTEEENNLLRPFEDPIMCTIMDIPVMLFEHTYDLNTLVKILDTNAIDPLTQYPFTERDIQSSRQTVERIEKTIEEINLKRAEVKNANIDKARSHHRHHFHHHRSDHYERPSHHCRPTKR